MKTSLTVGCTGQAKHRVVSENLVSFHNPQGPPVLATPWLLGVMEDAAFNAIAPHLDDGETSVGVGFDFQHLAPTPAGMTVAARAEITAVQGMMVTLHFEAHDGREMVGRGTHIRAVVSVERFRKRLAKKLSEPA